MAAILTVLLLCLCLCGAASAEIYVLDDIFASVDIPDTFPVVLRPGYLDNFSTWLEARGKTAAEVQQDMEDRGVLLQCWSEAEDLCFELTAEQSDEIALIYDVNEQSTDVRQSYRLSHSPRNEYDGYDFSAAEWNNSSEGRFLVLTYRRREAGETLYRGFMRRTIRNGYTITLDMQVVGRQVSAGDITAMNKLQETISFTQAEASPDAPLALTFTAPPPEFTNSASFSIKGVTRPGATVLAAYVSMKGESKTFSAQADGKGAFKVDVSLPGKDLYNMIVSVLAAEGTEKEEEISRNFQVEYDPTLLPVTCTSAFPDSFTTDSFKLAGTTLSGVSVQLEVNGKLQTKQTGNAKTFAFTLDTSKEGSYEILLTFTKKNYATRVFNYTIARVFDADAQRQAIRASAVAPTYSKLKNSAASYEGKYVRANGYVVSVEPGSGEWLITFATQKKGENYSDYIMVLSDAEVTLDVGTHATLYGTGAGTYKIPGDNDKTIVYPKVSLAFFDEMSK